MTKRVGEVDRNITEIELDNGVSAGIELRRLGPLVPTYEEHDARLDYHISLDAWMEMSELEKALIVAYRRNSNQMQNLQTEAEIRKINSEAKRKR